MKKLGGGFVDNDMVGPAWLTWYHVGHLLRMREPALETDRGRSCPYRRYQIPILEFIKHIFSPSEKIMLFQKK